MLWKRAYQTKVSEGISFPSLSALEPEDVHLIEPPMLVVGAVGPAGIPAAQLWLRLIATLRLGSFRAVIGLSGWASEDLADVENYLPRSLIAIAVKCANNVKLDLDGQTTFCAVLKSSGIAKAMFIGPATEDATDHLQNIMSDLAGRDQG